LYDIACELQHQAQIRANSEWITKMRDDWDRHQAVDDLDGSEGAGLRELK